MLPWVKAWRRMRWAFICSSVSVVGAVSARSAALPAACRPAGPVGSAVCALLSVPWSTVPACAALKVYSITAPPRMMKITVPTGRVPALQPTPAPAGARWGCWRSACPASAATPLPGCALPCASAPTTGPHVPAAGAATPTLCAARFLHRTKTRVIPRSAVKPWRSRYDKLGGGPGSSISPHPSPTNCATADTVTHLPTYDNQPFSDVHLEFPSSSVQEGPKLHCACSCFMPENRRCVCWVALEP